MPRTPSRFSVWRSSNRLTLRDVADLSGIHFTTLHRLENGERRGTPELKVRLARALGVPIRALFDPPEDDSRR